MPEKITRKIIFDTPVDKDKFQGQGHERAATLLVNTIKGNERTNISIGLEGDWGIGKSSVIKIAAQKLKSKNNSANNKYFIFTFDIWKSHGADFRRSILVNFVDWAIENFHEKRKKLQKIKRNIQFTSREVETTTNPNLTWYAIAMLVMLPLLPLLPIVYSSLSHLVGSKQVLDLYLLAVIPLHIFLIFVMPSCLDNIINRKRNQRATNPHLSYRERISKMLLSPKQVLDHKITHQVRETSPTDFEFHSTINEVLDVVQCDGCKLIFILDNIDRLPCEEIMKYWSLTRSVVSREENCSCQAENTKLITIVPYDQKLILHCVRYPNNATHNTSTGDSHYNEENLTSLTDRELFSKTFDEVVTVLPPVLSDAKKFFRENLAYSISKNVVEEDIFRCYAIFCHLLQSNGRKTTPRQVLSFVNELTKVYVLRHAEFKLPTIAAFLAHRDSLIANPTILNRRDMLNEQILELAADSEIIRNLAAMTYNVDKKMAFQVLLDSEIANAALSQDGNKLKMLSEVEGFELRVDAVVRYNISQWINTNTLARVIDNFAKCLPFFSANAALRSPELLIDALDHVNTISLTNDGSVPSDHYRLYLSIFAFAKESEKPVLLEKFINLSIDWIASNGSGANGKQFALFLMYITRLVEPHDLIAEFKSVVGKQHLSATADFLFELAGQFGDSSINFLSFRSVKMINYKYQTLADKSIHSPSVACRALVQLQRWNSFPADEWINIASGCLGRLGKSIKHENIVHLLYLVCLSLLLCKDLGRLESDVRRTFNLKQFFENLELGDLKLGASSYAFAAFIARETNLEVRSIHAIVYGGTKPNPSDSNKYSKFIEIYEDDKYLNELKTVLLGEIQQ